MKYNKIILVFILATIILLASGCKKKEVEVAPALSDTAEEMEVAEEPEKSEEELTEPEEAEPEETEQSLESETETIDNEISDNWMDGEFLLDGVKLKMPCPYEDVTKTGWTLKHPDTVPANGYIFIKLVNGTYEYDYVDISLQNPTEHELDAEECVVGSFFTFTTFTIPTHEESRAVAQVILPKGITYGATVDEVIEAYGEPYLTDDYTDGLEFHYMRYENEETYFRMELIFIEGFGLSKISFFWDEWNEP